MSLQPTQRSSSSQVYEPAHSLSESFSRRLITQGTMPATLGISHPSTSNSEMSWDFQSPHNYFVSRSRGAQRHDDIPRLSQSQSRPQFRSKVELFSTDSPPYGVQLVNDDYRTRNCFCRIRDVACLGCGNVIGYHVTQPCEPCMDACNNGHFWMFHCTEVTSKDRLNDAGAVLAWSQIPRADSDTLSTIRKNSILR
ncbi:Protein fam72a [Boothiomyces sp. JEL0866]|nr:Protein fam72a [Boothiomyces sp. JEL0866]